MEEGSNLEVQFTPQARADLLSVWHYSADRFGEKNADAYIDFLVETLQLLAGNPQLGRDVDGFPGLKRFLTKKRAGGFGHHMFFRVNGNTLQVVLIVHSAQHWANVIDQKLK